MDRISDAERRRIAELLAEGAPVWRLHKEINRSRHAIRRAVVALHRPPKREPRRSPLRLSLAGREEISRGLAAGEPIRGIARQPGRAPSTVCPEMAANGGRDRYRLVPRTGARSGCCTAPGRPSWLYARGCARLPGASWSCGGHRSRSRAGWALAYPDDPEMQVSHETIYLSLFVQARGALRKELTPLPADRPRAATARAGWPQRSWEHSLDNVKTDSIQLQLGTP